MKYYFCINSPIGCLCLVEENGCLCAVSFSRTCPDATEGKTPLLEKAAGQLGEYFGKTRREFDLPLNPEGTDFQKKVWEALKAIPYGETRSYAQIAAAAGNPKACRAVGGANNKNPLPVIIPCHRVIGADGGLTGYSGGLEIKRFLLNLERENRRDGH